MPPKVSNPRKKFLWKMTFVKHPIEPYLFQTATVPEVFIDQTEHGDINHPIKTGGRIHVGNLVVGKLLTTSGSDTWMWSWMMSVQDLLLGGGLTPNEYKETVKLDELAEDGVSILNSWLLEGVWPCRVNGMELDRMSSDNTIENIEFSVDGIDKI